jgi:hypothetical protein
MGRVWFPPLSGLDAEPGPVLSGNRPTAGEKAELVSSQIGFRCVQAGDLFLKHLHTNISPPSVKTDIFIELL